MKNSFLTLMLCLLIPAHYIQANDDHVEARLLRDSGDVIPLETIIFQLKKVVSGTVLEVELERENQKIVYEIELLQQKGIVKKVHVDARTGNILSIKNDN